AGTHRQKEQAPPPRAKPPPPPQRAPRPAYRPPLHLRRSLPEGGQGRSPDPARLQHRGDELAPGGNRRGRRARRPRHPLGRPSRHMSTRLVVPANITIILLPPKCPELNPVENVWQFMRENWLSNRVFKSYDDLVDHCYAALEQARRSALAHHVHRIAQMGPGVLISGTWYHGSAKAGRRNAF